MSEGFYDRKRHLYRVPDGAVAERLDPGGCKVIVDGTIEALTGKAGAISGTGRVKAPRARVIAEVDGRGTPLEPVA